MGEIPQQLGDLKVLEILNLSHNALSGNIPSTFNQLLGLTSVDLSYNQLKGPIPNIKVFHEAPVEAFRNNKGLCGNATGLKVCLSAYSHNLHVKKGNNVTTLIFALLGIVFLIFIIVGITLAVCFRKTKTKNKPKEEEHQNMFSVWSYDGKMVYENIVEATEDFDYKHCIGVGGHGFVYKAELPTGQVVAVKKLHPLSEDSVAIIKAFTNEIHSLTEIRHRNIVRLHGFCSHPRYLLLVYEFLDGGSLEKILNNDELALDFDWAKRVNVVKGVANALSYMHHECSHPIIHRDISSKNVLLDLEFEAHVSDFGTSKIMSSDTSHWTSFAGTIGYAAPAANIFGYFNVNLDLYKPNEADFFLFLRLLHFCGPKALKVQETKLVKVNQNISSNLSGSSSLALHICIRLSNSRALFLLKRPHLLLQQPTEIFIHGNDMEEAQIVRPRKQLHCSSSTHPSLNLTLGASMPLDQSSSTRMKAELFLFFVVLNKVRETYLVKVNQNTGFKLIMDRNKNRISPLLVLLSKRCLNNGGKRFNCGGMGSIEILLRPR
ncbi:hypothetical protein ACJW31_06G223100 [Castanea mollissima]